MNQHNKKILESAKKYIRLCYASDDCKNVAAGLFIYCNDDKTCLLLFREGDKRHDECWGIPGGKAKKNEFLNDKLVESAKRECQEETGEVPVGSIIDEILFKSKDFIYVTYILQINKEDKEKYQIKLNNEHSKFQWFDVNDLPKNIHGGLKQILPEIKFKIKD